METVASTSTDDVAASTAQMTANSPVFTMGESSSDTDPFMETLINQLLDTFYGSLKVAAKVVLDGSSISTETLKTMLSHHVESVRVTSDDTRAQPLVQLVESFIKDVNQLRIFQQTDTSSQVEEEFKRLLTLSQQQRESASKELADIDGDLQRIRGSISTAASDTSHATEQIKLFQKSIAAAEDMIKRGQILLERSTKALSMQQQKLEECTVLGSQLQQEEEARMKARTEVEHRLAQERSLNEATLREQAIATTNENRQVQLAAMQTMLLSRIERPM